MIQLLLRYDYTLKVLSIVDGIEYFMIPITFVFGFIGNLFGFTSLISKRLMRKRTPLFLLAVIGLFDTIFLLTQFQRWLAVNFYTWFIHTHPLCKVYFLLLRVSMLTSSALLLALIVSRFIKLYMGPYKLSLYSNIGQMCSRLCVVYIIALTSSGSWHEVWTSGLTNSSGLSKYKHDEVDYDINDAYKFFNSSQNLKLITELLESNVTIFNNYDCSRPQPITEKCMENIENDLLIEILNYFNKTVALIIFILLFIFSILVMWKIKANNKRKKSITSLYVMKTLNDYYARSSLIKQRVDDYRCERLNELSHCTIPETNELQVPATTSSTTISPTRVKYMKENDCVEIKKVKYVNDCKLIISRNQSELFEHQEILDFKRESCLSNKQKIKKVFTKYLVVISLLSSVFGLMYIVCDIIDYQYVYVAKLTANAECSNVEDLYKILFLRLPLILINVVHSIKFYLLFIFYKNFRSRIFNMIRIRCHFDTSQAKNFILFNYNKTFKGCNKAKTSNYKTAAAAVATASHHSMLSLATGKNSVSEVERVVERSKTIKINENESKDSNIDALISLSNAKLNMPRIYVTNVMNVERFFKLKPKFHFEKDYFSCCSMKKQINSNETNNNSVSITDSCETTKKNATKFNNTNKLSNEHEFEYLYNEDETSSLDYFHEENTNHINKNRIVTMISGSII